MSGYYSMQCMCGFWDPSNLKPQSQWTDEETKKQVQHQQFHLMQQPKAQAANQSYNLPVVNRASHHS